MEPKFHSTSGRKYVNKNGISAIKDGVKRSKHIELVDITKGRKPPWLKAKIPNGKRFLKVTISLELSTPEVHAELKENIQKVTDSILVLLSSKSFEDVYSVQGKFKLKDEVTTRVNRFLVVGHVKDAYFTEFIIQ